MPHNPFRDQIKRHFKDLDARVSRMSKIKINELSKVFKESFKKVKNDNIQKFKEFNVEFQKELAKEVEELSTNNFVEELYRFFGNEQKTVQDLHDPQHTYDSQNIAEDYLYKDGKVPDSFYESYLDCHEDERVAYFESYVEGLFEQGKEGDIEGHEFLRYSDWVRNKNQNFLSYAKYLESKCKEFVTYEKWLQKNQGLHEYYDNFIDYQKFVEKKYSHIVSYSKWASDFNLTYESYNKWCQNENDIFLSYEHWLEDNGYDLDLFKDIISDDWELLQKFIHKSDSDASPHYEDYDEYLKDIKENYLDGLRKKWNEEGSCTIDEFERFIENKHFLRGVIKSSNDNIIQIYQDIESDDYSYEDYLEEIKEYSLKSLYEEFNERINYSIKDFRSFIKSKDFLSKIARESDNYVKPYVDMNECYDSYDEYLEEIKEHYLDKLYEEWVESKPASHGHYRKYIESVVTKECWETWRRSECDQYDSDFKDYCYNNYEAVAEHVKEVVARSNVEAMNRWYDELTLNEKLNMMHLDVREMSDSVGFEDWLFTRLAEHLKEDDLTILQEFLYVGDFLNSENSLLSIYENSICNFEESQATNKLVMEKLQSFLLYWEQSDLSDEMNEALGDLEKSYNEAHEEGDLILMQQYWSIYAKYRNLEAKAKVIKDDSYDES